MSKFTKITPANTVPGQTTTPDLPGFTHIPSDELSFEDIHGDMSWLHKFLIGTGRGAMDLGQGAKQSWLMATDPAEADRYTDSVNEDLRIFDQLSEESPWAAGMGRVAGAAAPAAMLAPVSWPAAAAVGAAEGAAMFTPEADVKDKLVNAGVGGALGGSLQGAINTLWRMPKPSSSQAADALQTAADEGVSLRPQDVSNNPGVGLVGNAGEASVFASPKAAPGAETAAQRLVGEFDDAGPLLPSAKQFMADNAAEQKRLYGELQNMVGDNGVRLNPKPIRQRAQALIDEQMKSGMPNDKIVAQLEKIMEAVPEGNSFEAWKAFRTQVADQMVNWNKDGVSTAPLKQIYGQVTKGLEAVAEASGDDALKTFRDANQLTSQMMNVRKTPVGRLIEKQDETKLVNILRGKGAVKDSKESAQALFDVLDDAGRESGRHRLLNLAYESALDDKGVFSPNAFAKNLNGVKQRASVFFKDQPDVIQRIDDMANLMAHVKDPQQAAALTQIMVPATGAGMGSTAAGLMGADPMVGGAMGLAAAEIIPPLITRSRSGEALLAALRKYEPGSDMSNRIVQELMNLATSVAPHGAVVGVTAPEPPPLQVPIMDGVPQF